MRLRSRFRPAAAAMARANSSSVSDSPPGYRARQTSYSWYDVPVQSRSSGLPFLVPQACRLTQLIAQLRPAFVLCAPANETRPCRKQALVHHLDASCAIFPLVATVCLIRCEQPGIDQGLEDGTGVRAPVPGEDRQQLVRVTHVAGALRRDKVAKQLAHERQLVAPDAVEGRLGVLRQGARDAANGVVRRPGEHSLLTVTAVPQGCRGKGQQRQRPPLPLDGAQHVGHQALVFEPVSGLHSRLHEGAPERVAGRRPERHQFAEDRPQPLVLLAAEEEVVAHREQDMDIGVQGESREQHREPGLHPGSVEGEQFLELIDDDERLGVRLPPTAEEIDRDVGVVESDHLADSRGVARYFGGKRLPERDERGRPRRADQMSPSVGAGGDEPGAEETALPRPGRTDDRQQVSLGQPLPDPFDLRLPAEEVLGVRLREG